ncbi:hypothetical protein EMIT0357P_20201 [Pseudomonas marginalis]
MRLGLDAASGSLWASLGCFGFLSLAVQLEADKSS